MPANAATTLAHAIRAVSGDDHAENILLAAWCLVGASPRRVQAATWRLENAWRQPIYRASDCNCFGDCYC